jgi:hypothetical protein
MAADPDAAHPDRYDVWYSDKLWNLLPEIYRAEDSADFERNGPLRELVERIGAQAAIVRRSIDRLWEDQSIETCDDWVIDYLGDLFATNLVASLDARGRRVDVGKTIYYRRRKGTVGLLEELATDISGWSVRVVECFHRLGRTRHGLDPEIGLPAAAEDPRGRRQRAERLVGVLTRTGAGGFADLRHVHGASLASTAFDEFFHTGDVRRGRGMTGWHNIPHLGVFVWRLKSFEVLQVTPVRDAKHPRQYTFDPTGRDIPLFAAGEHPHGDRWVSPREHQVPGPITAGLLQAAFSGLYCDEAPRSLGVHRYVGGAVDPYLFVPSGEVSQDCRVSSGRFWIDPVRGRIIEPIAPVGPPAGPYPVTPATLPDTPYRVDYHYGFASEVGAGAYPRPVRPFERPETCPAPEPTASVTGGDASLPSPLGVPPLGPAAPAATATIVIGDSLTYTRVADVDVRDVELRAKTMTRPLIRPHPVRDWVFTGISDDSVLVLEGLFISGVDIVLRGSFDRVTLSCCTLDPGRWAPATPARPATPTEPAVDAVAAGWAPAADARPLAACCLRIEGRVGLLVVERSITGPIVDAAGRLESLIVRDSIVQATGPQADALAMTGGEVTLERATILGTSKVHRLDASESILHDRATVDDTQHGCVRFSAWPATSILPRKYESVMVRPREGLFVSHDFGHPAFAQLLATADGAITAGAEDGSEMGAFAREKSAIKERSLLIKYQEYLPLGLEPVIVQVT